MSPFYHLEFKVALDLWKICGLLEFIKILVCYNPTYTHNKINSNKKLAINEPETL